MYILVNGTTEAYTLTFKYVSGSGSTVVFGTTDKGTKIVYATADDGTDPNMVDTGISTNTLTGATGDITIDSPADLVLDAAGGNIEFKDAGTTQLLLDMDTTANAQIIQLKVNSDDLVFQQYDGNEVVRIADDRRLYFYDKGGEYIYGDGTDLHIVSGADVYLSANIGLTVGDDGEKIEGDGTDLTITGNTINLTATTDVALAVNTGLLLAGTEKIESDGTDLSITVGAGGDINIGTDIGLTFGNDGEKIEGDGTDLTIAGNTINLTAVTDVVIPNSVGIQFGGASEKIEGDGTDLTISANNLTVDAAADIILDAAGNNLTFKSGGTAILDISNSSSDAVIQQQVNGYDIIFKQYDGNTLLTIDDAGFVGVHNSAAGPGQLRLYEDTDNGTNYTAFQVGTQSGDVTYTLPTADGSDGYQLTTDGSGTLSWASSAAALAADDISAGDAAVTIGNASTSADVTLDSGDDVVIDAAGGNVEFKDAGTLQLSLDMDGTSGVQIIKLGVNADDLVFQQYDGNEVMRINDDRKLYFYDDGGENISSDGTDFTFASGNDINLTATTDINVPSDVGITFGDDGEKIEGDGTDLTISSSAVATIDAGTDIVLDADGADIFLKDGGTLFGTLTNSGTQLVIKSSSSGTTALTFSGANATFAGTLATAAGGFNIAGLDIDGATDIGADIVDADLFLIDDGAGGTNRKTTAARVKTYIGGGTSWQAVKTGNFTASAGQGVFVNTTSAAITITLPAGTIGDEVSIIDYAGTADSNNITVAANGSEKIHASTDDLTVATERAAFTLVFTDSTQGWLLKDK